MTENQLILQRQLVAKPFIYEWCFNKWPPSVWVKSLLAFCGPAPCRLETTSCWLAQQEWQFRVEEDWRLEDRISEREHGSLRLQVWNVTSNPGREYLRLSSVCSSRGFPGGSDDKESACNAGDPGSIPGSGRSPGEQHGNLLQYSCLEHPVGAI